MATGQLTRPHPWGLGRQSPALVVNVLKNAEPQVALRWHLWHRRGKAEWAPDRGQRSALPSQVLPDPANPEARSRESLPPRLGLGVLREKVVFKSTGEQRWSTPPSPEPSEISPAFNTKSLLLGPRPPPPGHHTPGWLCHGNLKDLGLTASSPTKDTPSTWFHAGHQAEAAQRVGAGLCWTHLPVPGL